MRGDCLFCWYWWNWWPSLFKLSLCERWLFVLLIFVKLIIITVEAFFRWEVIVCFVDICGIDDHYSVGNDRSPNASGNCGWRVRSTLYSPVRRVTVVRRLNETRFGPKKKVIPKKSRHFLMHWMSVKLPNNFQMCEHSWTCRFHIIVERIQISYFLALSRVARFYATTEQKFIHSFWNALRIRRKINQLQSSCYTSSINYTTQSNPWICRYRFNGKVFLIFSVSSLIHVKFKKKYSRVSYI